MRRKFNVKVLQRKNINMQEVPRTKLSRQQVSRIKSTYNKFHEQKHILEAENR